MFDLQKRLVALGVPMTVSRETVALVESWVRSSGPEWSVIRLKSIKTELLSRLSDGKFVAKWVARNSSGLPKGPFSWYFRKSSSGVARDVSLAINALNIYTAYISDRTTEIQKEKFFSSMESTDLRGTSSTPKLIPSRKAKISYNKRSMFFLDKIGSKDKFQLGADGKSHPEDDMMEQYRFSVLSSPVRSLLRRYPDVARLVVPYNHFLAISSRYHKASLTSSINTLACKSVGKISFIQEPGFKLRAVANPCRIVQRMLEPLKEVLRNELELIPQDCTFDQGKGVTMIRTWLSLGMTCHSIDLSDATNLFPRNYQLSLIKEVLGNQDSILDQSIAIFEEVCNMDWYVKDGTSQSLRRFSRGQPLGLGPSFFIFAYTHNTLLAGLCKKHNLPSDYVVLGDDVCIANDELARIYRSSLTNLGCKISESKSMVSDKFAEFAGKVITPYKVIHQVKWRDLDNSNFVDVCRQIGPLSKALLSKRQLTVIEALAEVPVAIGGMGWNPRGLSLNERLSTPLARLMSKEAEVNLQPFESTYARENYFFRALNSSNLSDRRDYLDNLALNELGFDGRADQALSPMTKIENSSWNMSTYHGLLAKTAGSPHPHWVVDTVRPPGYTPVHEQSDISFLVSNAGNIRVLENLISEASQEIDIV